MDKCNDVRTCLICYRATLQNSSIDTEKLASNKSILQDFLKCFHINVLHSEVNDLSIACQFCLTCEQFVSEWSSIQTQMTQLTRRAAQLEATLSALLLSVPPIQEQNHDGDVTEIIKNRIQNSQEVELPLLLQQTVDDIRHELRKKYLVSVTVDKIQLPPPPSELNHEEWDPLSGNSDNDDERMDDWRGDDESDAEYLPSKDQLDEQETSDQIFLMGIKTEEEASSDDSNHDPGELEEMKVNPKSKSQTKVGRKSQTNGAPRRKRRSEAIIPDGPNRFKYKGMSFQLNEEDQTYTCDKCGFRSLPKIISICRHLGHHLINPPGKPSQRQTLAIPDGPNTFNYNGHGLQLNDEDQCYQCSACDFKGNTNINSLLMHIREIHYTDEDKIKFTAVRTSDTEWLYGGEYKILAVGEKFKCVTCGSVKPDLYSAIRHIRTKHVDTQDLDEVVPLPVTDAPSVQDSTPIQGELQSVPYTFNPADNKYTCGICQAQISTSRRNLARHIKNHHSAPVEKVMCEICGKELLNQRSYKSHLKKHLTEPKNCPTCNKKFFCEKSFNRHIKNHTLGEAAKKYQCEYCGKKFLLAAHCRNHVMVHTGEKPHECHDCGKKFRYTSVLSQHRISAHGVQPRARNLMRINE